jgi:hypothetical protein
MSSPITLPAQFDISKLTTSDLKILKNGSSSVYVNYNGGKLRVQTPQLPIPFNAGDYKAPGQDKGNGNFKVNLSFRDRTSKTKVTELYDMIDRIDNFIIDKVTANADKWLKMAGKSRDVIKEFYTPSLRVSKNKDGSPRLDMPPTLPAALKQSNGAFDAEIYDKDLTRSKVPDARAKDGFRLASPLETLVRGTEATFQLDLTAIWIADKKFGVTWKVHSAWINHPGASASSGPGFVSDDGVPLVVATAAGGAGGPSAPAAAAAVSASEEADLLRAMLPATAATEEEGEDEEEDEEGDEEGGEEGGEVVEALPVPPAKAAPLPPPAPVVAPAPVAAAKKPITKVKKAAPPPA